VSKVSLLELETFDKSSGDVVTVVETPQGSRNKFKYDPELRLFRLHKALPIGAVFPFDFGFIPSTLGEDGDPVDMLLLMCEPAYPGTIVNTRLIGVIEAEQTEEGKTTRNDRLMGAASLYKDYESIRELKDLGEGLLSQIEHFFISYNEAQNRQFKPIGRAGSQKALSLVKEGMKRFKAQDR
jgi:inorganic pyrophosphatase